MKKSKTGSYISLPAGAAGILMLSALVLLPASALAQDYECHTTTPVTIRLPASINLSQSTDINTAVFSSDNVTVKYTCYVPAKGSPKIIAAGDFVSTQSALKAAGLKLQVTANGMPWVPGGPGASERFSLGPENTDNVAKDVSGTATLSFQLILVDKITRPTRVSVPANGDMLHIIPHFKGYSDIIFGTSGPSMVFYIPECILKISVPGEIDLGRVITGGTGTLPAARPFKITTTFNPECSTSGVDISQWGNFALSLKLLFDSMNGELTPDSRGIVLKNQNSMANGLKLVIKDGTGSTPVVFNDWSDVGRALTTTSGPVILPYFAAVEPVIPGNISSAKTGKFSQQITVRVNYF